MNTSRIMSSKCSPETTETSKVFKCLWAKIKTKLVKKKSMFKQSVLKCLSRICYLTECAKLPTICFCLNFKQSSTAKVWNRVGGLKYKE